MYSINTFTRPPFNQKISGVFGHCCFVWLVAINEEDEAIQPDEVERWTLFWRRRMRRISMSISANDSFAAFINCRCTDGFFIYESSCYLKTKERISFSTYNICISFHEVIVNIFLIILIILIISR